MDIDEVFAKRAEFGPYQKKIFLVLNGLMIYTAFQNIHNAFLGAEPEFRCVRDGRVFEGCPKEGASCDSFRFPGHDFTSIVSEWDLVCGESYKAQLVQSIYMAGIFFGSFLFGKIADAYGRKMTLIVSTVGIACASLCGMFATSYNYYITMRFLAGAFNAGWSLASFVILTEILAPSKRGLTGIAVPAFFAVGIAMFALLAYYVRDWRSLTLVTSVPGFIGIYFIWLIPESPRWLYSIGRVSEAEHVLCDIITRNTGVPPTQPIVLRKPLKSSDSSKNPDGFLSLFTVPVLLVYTVTNVLVWFVNCCVYYGLTIGVGNIGGNFYVSMALSGLVELPAYAIAWYMIESRLGRKWSLSVCMLLGGTFCMMMPLIPQDETLLRSLVALLGKMIISCSFSILWLFSAELYPTSIRNQALSVCTGSSRIGGVVAPMILQLGTVYPSMDFAIFGVFSILAGIVSSKLPETRKQPMYETIRDLLQGQGHTSTVAVQEISEDKVRLLQEKIEGKESFQDV